MTVGRILASMALAMLLLFGVSAGFSYSVSKQLTETQQLKADKHLLKVQLYSDRVQQVQRELQKTEDELKAERSALEADFRKTLAPEEKWVFNWQTRKFDAPKSEDKPNGGGS